MLNLPHLHLDTFAQTLCLGTKCCARKPVQSWTLTALREKLSKIGAKVVSHSKYIIFQLAEISAPRHLLAAIQNRIGRLRQMSDSGRNPQ